MVWVEQPQRTLRKVQALILQVPTSRLTLPKKKMLGIEADRLELTGQDKQDYIDSFTEVTVNYSLSVATGRCLRGGYGYHCCIVFWRYGSWDKLFIDGKVPDEMLPLWKQTVGYVNSRKNAVVGEGGSEGLRRTYCI